MAAMTTLLIPLLAISSLLSFSAARAPFNVVSLGARPDGKADASKAFLKAWAKACWSPRAETVHVPRGRYVIGPVIFRGPCRSPAVKFWMEGTLVAPLIYSRSWIQFESVDGLSIFGGTLDGQGSALWACKVAGRSCPVGPSSLTIGHSKNVKIIGLTSINSKLFHIFIYSSEGVTVQGTKLLAPEDSPNTDGIHVQSSAYVTVTDTTIKSGDDCISLGFGTTNFWAEDIQCGPGHGISIGSLANHAIEAGVRNVTVKSVAFTGTQNGLRIKTWGRPSNGFVKGVLFQNATMNNVQNPIAIDQNYCPALKGCPKKHSGIKISNVVYDNIKGTSATAVAINLDCSPSNPCRGIGLHDINLRYRKRVARSVCKHVTGRASAVISPPSCL